MQISNRDNPYEPPQTIGEAKVVAAQSTESIQESSIRYSTVFLKKFLAFLTIWNFSLTVLMYSLIFIDQYLNGDFESLEMPIEILLYPVAVLGNFIAAIIGLSKSAELSQQRFPDFSMQHHITASIFLPILASLPAIGCVIVGAMWLVGFSDGKKYEK